MQALTEQACQLAARLEAMSAEAVARRRPLTRAAAAKPEVKLFNPRFEEAFVAGKDYDPDRWVYPVSCVGEVRPLVV